MHSIDMEDPPEKDDALADIREKLAQATTRPGVYLMKNAGGRVIYVGKARNLRKRLASYFQRLDQGHPDFKTEVMLKKVASVDTLVTASEKEALILESTLIKRHRPRYNVTLKDDKRYPVLRFDTIHPYPSLIVARRIEKDGALYFGPFASAHAVRQTLKIVNKTFRLRKCKPREFKTRTRPCLHFQMDACLAPCCLEVDPAVYADIVKEVVLFLRGRTPELIKKLKSEMTTAAQIQDFEQAARVRDKVFALERTVERQVVVTADFADRDVIVTAGSGELALVTLMFIRNGYLLGFRNFDLDSPVGSEADIIAAFMKQYYEKTGFIPKEILVPVDIEDRLLIEEMLSQIKSQKVRILRPQRGEKTRLVTMAKENAANVLKDLATARAGEQAVVERLGQRLHMTTPPRLIECIDNSNISGTVPVAGLVVFENGTPKKSAYRKYTIRTVAEPDDYATMAEVLGRRFGKAEASRPLPDLLMLDGGKGQLNIAVAILKSLALDGKLDLLAIAKMDEQRGETEDKIYLPGRSNPLALGKDRDVLLFLQRIRDEAHRFAITFHRRRRTRISLTSELDGISGVGKKRKQALLKRFGSIDAMREATVGEIESVPGMNRRVAASVAKALGKRQTKDNTPRPLF